MEQQTMTDNQSTTEVLTRPTTLPQSSITQTPKQKKTLLLSVLLIIIVLLIGGGFFFAATKENRMHNKAYKTINNNNPIIQKTLNDKFKIAFIEKITTKNPDPKLYTSNIDGSDKIMVVNLAQLVTVSNDSSQSSIKINKYLPETNRIIIQADRPKNAKAEFSVDLTSREIEPYSEPKKSNSKCKGTEWTQLTDQLSIKHDYTYYDDNESEVGPPTRFINYDLCESQSGSIRVIADPDNEINKEKYVQDIGVKEIIFHSSKIAYIMAVGNGYDNQIDAQFEQLDTSTGKMMKPTNLSPIETKIKDGMSISYINKLYKDKFSQNHVLYRATKNKTTTYYDLNLETLEENPMTITESSVVANWSRTDDVIGAGFDFESYDLFIDNSPIKQNVNECTYYNLTTHEIVGFPDLTNFMCDEVLLK